MGNAGKTVSGPDDGWEVSAVERKVVRESQIILNLVSHASCVIGIYTNYFWLGNGES